MKLQFIEWMKIFGLIFLAGTIVATTGAKMDLLHRTKVDIERYILDSASTTNRISVLEQVLLQELPSINSRLSELCKATRAGCK